MADAARTSARAAGMGSRAVYLHYMEPTQFSTDEGWAVSDNFETGAGSFMLRNGEWFWRDPHTGEDRRLEGGHAEAVESARTMFTG